MSFRLVGSTTECAGSKSLSLAQCRGGIIRPHVIRLRHTIFGGWSDLGRAPTKCFERKRTN